MKNYYKSDQHINMTDNINITSYIFCCFYYFYFGKEFNNIKSVIIKYDRKYDNIYYELNKMYKIESAKSEDNIFYRNFVYADIDFLLLYREIRRIHIIMNNKIINIKDMPEVIKRSALQYEKELYW